VVVQGVARRGKKQKRWVKTGSGIFFIWKIVVNSGSVPVEGRHSSRQEDKPGVSGKHCPNQKKGPGPTPKKSISCPKKEEKCRRKKSGKRGWGKKKVTNFAWKRRVHPR